MKAARIIYLMVGVIAPIFTGGLHTATHFSELTTPEIKSYLQKQVEILGNQQSLWNAWGVISIMMGSPLS